MPKKILSDFEKFCKEKNITGGKKEELMEKLREIYDKSSYEVGEAIGVIAAQSISEPSTQMSMRSYTMASMVGGLTKVVQGLPRVIEIFDLRKTFDKSMTIYLKEKYNSKTSAERIANDIKEKTIGDVIKSHSIDLLNMQIELEFGNLPISKEELKEILSKFGDVSRRENKFTIKPKKLGIKGLRKLRNKILSLRIAGISDIKKVIVTRDFNDWIIETVGSNLKAVLDDERVDEVRTTTDDIDQIYDVLGIEAARNAILREIKETLDKQGLDVDLRHLILVADIMTTDGVVRPIGRYGVSGRKPSVLAKANFEETKKHLTAASLFGKTDKLESTVENLMIGQIVPAGTGTVNLVVDTEKMKKIVQKGEMSL